MKRNLLQEIQFSWDWELCEDEEAKKRAEENGFLAIIKAVGMNVGRITENGTLYPRELIYRELKRLRPLMDEGKVVGLVDHPSFFTGGPSVMREGIRWLEASMDADHNVRLVGGILDTEPGRHLYGARKGGVKHGVSSRGWGTTVEKEMDEEHPEWELNKDKKGEKFREVQDDYELETWDIVTTPSNKGAWTESDREEALKRLREMVETVRHEDVDKDKDEDKKEDTTMEFRTLKEFRELFPAEIVEAVLNEYRDEIRDDIEAEILRDMSTDVEQRVSEALKDSDKLAETLGLDADVLKFITENLEELRVLAEANFSVPEALRKAVRGAKADQKDERIATLEEKLDELQVKIEEATEELNKAKAEREKAEKELAKEKAEKELDEKLEKAVAGKPLAKRIKEEARRRLELGVSDEDIEKAVNEAAKYIETILDEGKVPVGKGNIGADGSGDSEQGELNARRKAFKEKYPSLAIPGDPVKMEAAFARANLTAKERLEWIELFGPEAIKENPLPEGFLD